MNVTAEVLTPMQVLSERALVVTFKGELQRNDINDEFKEAARIALDSISLELNTDDDFAEAEKNIKACKDTEDKLSKLLDDILSGSEDVSKVKDTLTSMVGAFGTKRSILTKKVKTRKEERKKEITDAGKKEVARVLALSPLSRTVNVDNTAIDNAIKNKKKYSVMEEAVTVEVINQIYNLAWLEVTFAKNSELLDKSAEKYPGIYPDKHALAIEPTDKLELIIGQRESAQALKLKEKAEKDRLEKEAAEKKAEEDRLAKEKAEAESLATEQQKQPEIKPEPEPATIKPEIVPDPFVDAVIPPLQDEPPPPCFEVVPPVSKKQRIKIMVEIESDDVHAVINSISNIPDVIWISN